MRHTHRTPKKRTDIFVNAMHCIYSGSSQSLRLFGEAAPCVLQHRLDALIQSLDRQALVDPRLRLAHQRGAIRRRGELLGEARQRLAQAAGEVGRARADAGNGRADEAAGRGRVRGELRGERVEDVLRDARVDGQLAERGEHEEEALGDVGLVKGLLARNVKDGHGDGAVEGRVAGGELPGGRFVNDVDLGSGGRFGEEDTVLILALVVAVVDAQLVVIRSPLSRGQYLFRLAPALLVLHPGEPLHLAAGVLDPEAVVGGAEAAAAHEEAAGGGHVAVGGGAAAGHDPQVGVGGQHAQRVRHGAAPALRGLDAGRVGEVLAPERAAARVAADAALVDAEHAALARVRRRQVPDLEALAALGPQRLEGLLPLRVGGPVVGGVAGGEDLVFILVSFLDNGADFVLQEKGKVRGLAEGELGRGWLDAQRTLVNISFSSHSRSCGTDRSR